MKPTLYYKVDENGIPFDNFCSDACIGANEEGISCIAFSDIRNVPRKPYNIVVSTVEDSEWWLKELNESIMSAIDDSWAKEYKGRGEKLTRIENIDSYPCFIKPFFTIKAFTGIIVNNKAEAKLFTQDFKGTVSQQEIVEFESEYRIYVHKDRGVLGMKHYLGDAFLTPQRFFVEDLLKSAKENLKENSYSLDIGIDKNYKNYLIEINDGWAIGNYGLSPKDYYSFVKTRWLQLTEVLK